MSYIATAQGHDLRFAPINATTTSGDNTIVAADAGGRKIKVVSYALTSLNANTVQWKSGASALSGAMPLGANGGVSCTGEASTHLFETAANAALVLTLGAGVGGVQGHVAYLLEA